MTVPTLHPQTFSFLQTLTENNHKAWFDENRPLYNSIKQQLEIFVSQIIYEMAFIEPDIAHLQPKNTIFRINKDVRFSKNKEPYKNNLGFYLNKGGKNALTAGYYVHIQPNASFIAGGLYCPQPDVLQSTRQNIETHYPELINIINEPIFKNTFTDITCENTLKTAPKGFDPNSKAISYLKMKDFLAIKNNIPNEEVLSSTYINTIIQTFKIMQPFIQFLNKGI